MNSFERHSLDIAGAIIDVSIGRRIVRINGPHLLKAALLGIGLIVVALVTLNYAYVYPFSPNNNVWGYACGLGYSVLALCGMTLIGNVVTILWKSSHQNLLQRGGK